MECDSFKKLMDQREINNAGMVIFIKPQFSERTRQ